jgi:TonB family protein
MIQNGVEIAYAGFETRRISPQSMVEMDSIVLKEDQPAMAEIVLHHSKEEPAGKHIAARSSETQYSKMKTRAFDGPVIGWPKYLAYLEQNRRLPEAARKAGISGTVELSFYIDQQGKPQNIKILKSLGYGCDPEAIRLLQQGPSWNPSTSTTDPYVLSITFE